MATFAEVLASEISKVEGLIAAAKTADPNANIDHLWSRYLQLKAGSGGGGGSVGPVAPSAPMQRQNITGPQVNYFEAISAPASDRKIDIYSISLIVAIPVRVEFLSGPVTDLGPIWATYQNAQIIEPPFSEPFSLPSGKPFTIRLDNGEDDVGISGTIEYKEVDA